MPELPEVETIRRALQALVTGRRIVAVGARPVRMRRPLEPSRLVAELVGAQFLGARRRGKYLLLDVDRPGSLLVHLGMSGRMLVHPAVREPPPHTHLALDLDDGRTLRLVDPRRFGFAVWLAREDENADPSLAGLGLEPLEHDFEDRMPSVLAGRRAAIKAVLLDQRLVAGVGNIYAAEALWRAGIRPTRPAGSLSRTRARRLAACVRDVLSEAVAQGGTTIRDYSGLAGEFGRFAVALQVYGRSGLPCQRCDRPLSSSCIGGRTTVWCRSCQR